MAAFPVTCRLVDSRFFAYAADAFIAASPPRRACLDLYGACFPGFLAAFPACAGLPYLPDVARLEWALHRAARAEPVATLQPAALAAVDPARTADVQFAFDPAIAGIASDFPVDEIWVADQPGVDGKSRIDLAGKSAWLQVRQDDGLARLDLLTPAIFAFRQSLATGARLQDAVEVALNRAADFDVRAAVGALFAERLLTGWRLAPTF